MNALVKTKKSANLTIDAALLSEAKELGVNISRCAEEGLRKAVRHAKGEVWKKENAEAIESSNAWVEKNGLPLEKFRPF